MFREPPQTGRSSLLILWLVFAAGQLVGTAVAQNRTANATTDPFEARILNSMFARLGVSAPDGWNISGELCSGVASDRLDDPHRRY